MPVERLADKGIAKVAGPHSDAQTEEYLVNRLQAGDEVRDRNINQQEGEE